MLPFDPTGPLPRGLTLLEASAGTGKTYGITNLVLRLVAEEGVPLRALLLVTFTRAATAELRERVRQRLSLGLAVVEGRAHEDDPVLAALAASPSKDLLRKRLSDALVAFDECLISTLHGFCQRMLQDYAFEAGADFDLELVPDNSARLEELVDDHLSKRLHRTAPGELGWLRDTVGLRRADLLQLARAAVDDPDLRLLPDTPPPAPTAWSDAIADLNSALQAGLADTFLAGVAQAKASGALQPRQRTYTPTTLPPLLDELTTWAASSPAVWDERPDALVKLGAAALSSKLQPEEALPDGLSDACARLDALQELGQAIADAERASFVRWVRGCFAERNAIARVQAYADLVRGLARAVSPGAPGRQALIGAVRGRFRAALIDEFQDTDAAQWTLFQTLFHAPDHWLFLIGDPKQAIYGFRGANVHVYLQARQAAGERCYTMSRNYRSDAGLVQALNHVMDAPGFFGDDAIDYVRVDTPNREPAARLLAGAGLSEAPLQLRFIDGATAGDAHGALVNKGVAGELIPRLVADDIVELLSAGTTLAADGGRALRPSDLAVLVRTGRQAQAIQQALTNAGVPAATTGTANVLQSAAAADLERWMLALQRVGHDGAARAAATSPLFGRDATLLQRVDADEPDALRSWERWLQGLATARELLAKRGFLAALRDTLEREEVTERLLAQPGGERHLTDLLHVAELLHAYAIEQRVGLDSLIAWLARGRDEGAPDADAAALRLERDDDAVCVLTMHKAKGLEYPVVFAPYLWEGRLPDDAGLHLIAPDPSDRAARVLDVRASRGAHTLPAATVEAESEALRLLYVALTRARHRCVVYTGHLKGFETGPLLTALHGQGDDRRERAMQVLEAGRDALWQGLEALSAGSTGLVHLSRAHAPVDQVWSPPDAELPTLAPAAFTRDALDRTWRRHSYTSLLHDAPNHHAPADREGVDVDAHSPVDLPLTTDDDVRRVPLADFPAGAQPGIFLHEVLEDTDFAWGRTPEGRTALRERLDELLPRHGLDATLWAEPLTEHLSAVLTTPLGGPLGGSSLADIQRTERFDELRFDLPVRGGRSWRAGVDDALSGTALLNALGAAGPRDALRADYLAQLAALPVGDLAGFLTGSIDLVFRQQVNGQNKWFIADYKSNHLGDTVAGYAPSALRDAMEGHHYPLQAHLYTLALHRLLRWRVPDYDYERDVGGVYYLFLRGMTGEQAPTPAPPGCFFDRPPLAVVQALDTLFASSPQEAS